jgi:hypothetical protein
MSNDIRFGITRLVGTGKQGILTPDENGYYTTVLGGLDVFNTAGEFYVKEGARDLFEKNSAFMRRVERGALRAEVDHPQFLPGMSEQQFVNRMLNIDESNVCAHISEVWLDFDNFTDTDGRRCIGIMGKVTPSGPHGDFLKKQFDNPLENVCFSVRGVTQDKRVGGIVQRTLTNIITFDYVNEPGIPIAEKYNSPALETRTDYVMSKSQFIKAINKGNRGMFATESSKMLGNEIAQTLGIPLSEKKTNVLDHW